MVCYVGSMPSDPHPTRTRILDAAEGLVLDHGFAGTTIEAILERTGFTKGAFFHHFASKDELAQALVERYAEHDAATLEEFMARAERLGRDPLQQVLIFVGLFEETMDELTEPSPGCLFASYCYEAQLFDDRIHEVIREAFERWRARLGEKIRAAIESHPPRLPVDPDDLADAFTVIVEGAFIVSKTMDEPEAVARQLRHYRNYLELLFDAA